MTRYIFIPASILAAVACGESADNTASMPTAPGPGQSVMEPVADPGDTTPAPADQQAAGGAPATAEMVDPVATAGAGGEMMAATCLELGTCEMPRPELSVPNEAHPEMAVGDPISETLDQRHNNQPMMLNGYLFLSGNGTHSIWNMEDPTQPVLVKDLVSENVVPGKEAESHQMVFAKYPGEAGDTWYAATTSGYGVDIWDVTDMPNASHVGHAEIDGIDHGDVDNGVWGKAWQGTYLYVGANNTGLHIVDVTDPTNPSVIKTLTNDQTGNFKPGPLFAVGDKLVVTSSKGNGGVAVLDVADPENPVLTNSIVPEKDSYIGWFYGGHVFLQGPLRAYDVLTDPFNITEVSSTDTVKSEYLSFGDDMLFLGQLRPNPGVTRYDVSDMSAPSMVERIAGREHLGEHHDDQFSLKVGNLIVMSDDENIEGTKNAVDGLYAGSFVALENPMPDAVPPRVKNVIPEDGGSALPTSSIGFAFSDQIEPATVGGPSLIVRPVGGEPVSGKYGFMRTVVNFKPDQPLAPGEYEVVLPKEGLCDLGGNSIAEEFKSTFTVE